MLSVPFWSYIRLLFWLLLELTQSIVGGLIWTSRFRTCVNTGSRIRKSRDKGEAFVEVRSCLLSCHTFDSVFDWTRLNLDHWSCWLIMNSNLNLWLCPYTFKLTRLVCVLHWHIVHGYFDENLMAFVTLLRRDYCNYPKSDSNVQFVQTLITVKMCQCWK